MSYFHYTSRKAAQDIICGVPSCLRLGPSRNIYLSPTSYTVGHEAASELAIIKEVEIACVISEDDVIVASQPERARQIMNPDGSIARRGGGFEVTTPHEVSIDGAQWFALSQP